MITIHGRLCWTTAFLATLIGFAAPGTAAAKKPIGYIDIADNSGIEGWTCDPDHFGYVIKVEVRAPAPPGWSGSTLIATATANRHREPEVAVACGNGHVYHGWRIDWPDWMRYETNYGTGYSSHRVEVRAIDWDSGEAIRLENVRTGKKFADVDILENPATRPDLKIYTPRLERENGRVNLVYEVCNDGLRSTRGLPLSFHNPFFLQYTIQWSLTCPLTTDRHESVNGPRLEPGECSVMTHPLGYYQAVPYCDVTMLIEAPFRELDEANNFLERRLPQ